MEVSQPLLENQNIEKSPELCDKKCKKQKGSIAHRFELQNLIFANTYALIDGNSKSITAGIILRGQEFQKRISLTLSSYKVINFDSDAWLEFYKHFDTTAAYFGDDHTFQKVGNPKKLMPLDSMLFLHMLRTREPF